MVQAYVDLDDLSNRAVNVVKARFGLRDKSEALNALIHEYVDELLEPEFKPAFVESVRRSSKGPFKKVDDFGRHYGIRG